MTMRNSITSRQAFSALAIGLALASTPLFWGQAVIAEVYSLFLMFVALLLLAIAFERSDFVIGLTFGLAVCGHLTGLLLLPLVLWRIGRSGFIHFFIGAALGISPFLLLPWLSSTGSPVTWGEPQTIGGWWWLVSARLYAPNVFGLPIAQLPERISDWFTPQIMLPLLVWISLLAVAIWKMRRELTKGTIALATTALLYFAYAISYRTHDAAVLMLPGVLLTSVIVGSWLLRFDSLLVWLLPAVMLIMGTLAVPISTDGALRDQAVFALSRVPAEAIVLTPGDATISALWYFHHVEGLRPDIIVVDQNLFQFDWYRASLMSGYPEIAIPADDDLEVFVAENSRSRAVCPLSLANVRQAACLPHSSEAPLD